MTSSRLKKITPVVAITLGDPAGIGPEVIAKTLRDPRLPKGFRFELLGQKSGPGIHPGRLTKTSARIALKALEAAAQGCLSGKYAAMVTGPVQKESLAALQRDFIGQTEFLARACGLPDAAAVMVLNDPKLTVALCTNHCSLPDAVARLTTERIVYVAEVMRDFLQEQGIAKPRLAFASVNPHGGEGGLFGDHDMRVVQPACQKLLKEKIVLQQGPADTIFHYAVHKKAFDAVLCAYHDQGLIPFKLVAFETGVNATLGLPLIRTSPDHGTALEIAGQGRADHRSMLAAVRLACRLASQRKKELDE
jgi:4-hydroxythreonine-4-phosphate dehydrogenase